MENTLKLKLWFFFGSLCFLTFLNLYENNFYKKVTISKWRQLEWVDFQGTITPFTQYDAGITSELYLETDSAGQYRAYAGQNSQKSWVRNTAAESLELLKHEQYHFNVTEIFARKLNEFIASNPDLGEHAYRTRLRTFTRQRDQMQTDYDKESEHSTNQSKQWLWEYKIDSMLLAHSSEKRNFIDPYSGLSIDFPSNLETYSRMSQDIPMRTYGIDNYGISIETASFQSSRIDRDVIVNMTPQIREANNQDILESEQTHNSVSWTSYDPEKSIVKFEKWLFQHSYSYFSTVSFRGNFPDSLAFAKIADSITASLKVAETAAYWVKKAYTMPATQRADPNADGKPGDKDYECMVFEEDKPNGFYGTPMITNTDSLILPYQIIAEPDSLILQAVLVAQTSIFISESQNSEHIFKIAVRDLPQEPFLGSIGYLLKSDSTAGCYQFYNQSIPIWVGHLDNK